MVQNLGLLLMGESCIFFIALFQPPDVLAAGSSSQETRPADEIAIICPNLKLAHNGESDDEPSCCSRQEISLCYEAAVGSMALAGVCAAGIWMGGPWVENLTILLVAELCILAIVSMRPLQANKPFKYTLTDEIANDLPLIVSV